MNRTLPHDLEVEKAVLGCVVLDNRLGSVVCGELDANSFHDTRNRYIFEALASLVSDFQPVDAVTIHGMLPESAKRSEGMALYLSTLTDAVGTVQRVESYISILKDLARRRALIFELGGLSDLGYGNMSHDEYCQHVRKSVTSITDDSESSSMVQIKDLAKPIHDEILSKNPPKGLVKTWINAIDSEYGGLWPGVVTMLAARPSMGKSALALSIIANAAMSGKKVLFFSLEDTKEMVMKRLYARFADINLNKIIQRNLTFEDVQRLEKARYKIEAMPITIDDTSGYTPQAVRGKLQQQIDSEGVDLVVLDHLLKIKGDGGSRYEKITDSIEQLTAIIKESGKANLILHQLNRQNVMRENKVPTLSDLRGSGDIEQEIRVAWFLHRDHYYEPETADPNDATLLIAKNSHGPTGSIGLHCDLSRMHFGDRRGYESNKRDDNGARSVLHGGADRKVGGWT